jgi:hypothetical protein
MLVNDADQPLAHAFGGRMRSEPPGMLIVREIGKLSSAVIRSHELPELILVQPNRVGVPGYEFIDGQAFNQLRARNPLLLSVNEYYLILLSSLAPSPLFGGGSFALRLGLLAFFLRF